MQEEALMKSIIHPWDEIICMAEIFFIFFFVIKLIIFYSTWQYNVIEYITYNNVTYDMAVFIK